MGTIRFPLEIISYTNYNARNYHESIFVKMSD